MNLDKPIHPTTITTQVLMFLIHQKGKWATWGPSFYMPTVQSVFPVGTKEEVQRRFMNRLISKGLVDGCNCGCRGDYVLTEEGLTLLAEDCLLGEQEVANLEKPTVGLGASRLKILTGKNVKILINGIEIKESK